MKYKVIVFDGGMGDIVMLSAALRSHKKQHPGTDLVVASAYHDLLIGNPDITKLYNLGMLEDCYERWVKLATEPDQAIKLSPYTRLVRLGKKHFISYLCEEIGCEWDCENPQTFYNKEEYSEAIGFVSTLSLPPILIQAIGAHVPVSGNFMIEEKNWIEEYWIKVIEGLKDKFTVVQVGGPGEKIYPGALSLIGKMSPRQAGALLTKCVTFVSVDSFLAHLAASVYIPGVVLYGRSDPKIWGYKHNINLYHPEACADAPCGRPEGAFLDEIYEDGKRVLWKCKDRKCMKAIKPEEVIESVMKIARARGAID